MSLKAIALSVTAAATLTTGCLLDRPRIGQRITPKFVNAGSGAADVPSDGTSDTEQPLAANKANAEDVLLPAPAVDAGTPQPIDAGPPIRAVDPRDCVMGQFCAVHEPDQQLCGTLELEATVMNVQQHGNILVVFDRSGSMETVWGSLPKYRSAGEALIGALKPLQSQLTVGGVFFPSLAMMAAPTTPNNACPKGCDPFNIDHWLPTGAGCCLPVAQTVIDPCPVNPISQPDQLDFAPASSFVNMLPLHWSLNDPTGSAGTPLERGIQRAAEAIGARKFAEKLVVLVITDGEPNCGTNEQRVLDQVMAWRRTNIATYVVGLPGAQPAADFLTQLAKAGGTASYIDPKDPAELQARLRQVVNATVRTGLSSCTIALGTTAPARDRLQLIITQGGKPDSVPSGPQWMINEAGDSVTLQGDLCQKAMAGSFDELRFEFGCPSVPPKEPPAPVPTPD
jgi:hypothetical protein